MVSAVRAEDSSSASADSSVTIQKTEWASAGILKVCLLQGPSFFVREDSLPAELLDQLVAGMGARSLAAPDGEEALTIGEDAAASLLAAGRAYLAERTAMGYLARAEQCRFSLEVKLARKGFSPVEAASALDRLAATGCLDDVRFAGAWLRNRAIHHCEGKQRLLAELRARGISASDASTALREFLSVNDEASLCRKAAEKLRRTGKTGATLEKALARKGFSCKIIRVTLLQGHDADNPF